jgi:hypothetical protein
MVIGGVGGKDEELEVGIDELKGPGGVDLVETSKSSASGAVEDDASTAVDAVTATEGTLGREMVERRGAGRTGGWRAM